VIILCSYYAVYWRNTKRESPMRERTLAFSFYGTSMVLAMAMTISFDVLCWVH
jgi:hypothetical protein